MDSNKYFNKIKEQYINVWGGNPTIHRWDKGPVYELPSEFKILKFAPSDTRNMWTYATCGMSTLEDLNSIEIHIFAPQENDDLIELLTVIAHYHRTGSSLNLNHTVNFGQPWWPNSRCEYGLLSLPYLDGPSLEWLDISGKKVRFLWLIPITKSEVDYKKKYGIDALEECFDNSGFNYLNPLRTSVVRSEKEDKLRSVTNSKKDFSKYNFLIGRFAVYNGKEYPFVPWRDGNYSLYSNDHKEGENGFESKDGRFRKIVSKEAITAAYKLKVTVIYQGQEFECIQEKGDQILLEMKNCSHDLARKLQLTMTEPNEYEKWVDKSEVDDVIEDKLVVEDFPLPEE